MSICPESHKHDGSTVCYKKHACRCGPCSGLASGQKRAVKAAKLPRVMPKVACERCGVLRVSRTGPQVPWCADCRLVEGAAAQKAWAA